MDTHIIGIHTHTHIFYMCVYIYI